MDLDQMTTIMYDSPYLSYDAVRKGLIQNREKLISAGYKCNWNSDLDMNRVAFQDLTPYGFVNTDQTVKTAFSKNGFSFPIEIYKSTHGAQIHHSFSIPKNQIPELRLVLNELESISGISVGNIREVFE
ncbi:hypothetical protein JXA48_00605 [Candidatus Woesearchaeota archaeon]|nr:hypothetical protein [Candidatus Woesearchaeota archaeon]